MTALQWLLDETRLYRYGIWFNIATTQGRDQSGGLPAMVKRTSFAHDACPIARSLDALGDWWSMLIIREALLGARRFGELQKNLGLAKNILAVRLRSLVDRGILEAAPASDGSAFQEYVLTAKGRGVFPVLVALRQWSEQFDEHPEEIATILVDREKGRPVRRLELHSQDGRLLRAADTALKRRPEKKSKRSAKAGP
jgi:DNA-binding HxlR family transcriptional regulator